MVAALIHWLISAAALYLTSKVTPGFRIRDFSSAMIASVIIGLANFFIRPLLLFLTLPLTIITLGLFIFVVNAIVLRICAGILKNFDISNWFSAIMGAFVLSVFNWLFAFFFNY